PQNSHSSILIRWDLTGLAPGSAVHEAVLDFDVTNPSAGQVYELFEVRRDWVEGEANWLQYAAGQEWQKPGASGLEDRGTVPLARLAATSRGPLSVRLGTKALEVVRRWIADPSTNQGFILVGTTQTNSLEFSSRESTVPEKRPRLTITHSLPR
ncbi:MAG: DNRLRE domain-containing protein, partial [Planctomycetota bacterium]